MIRTLTFAAFAALSSTLSYAQEAAPYLDDRSTADRVVASLYNAINRHETFERTATLILKLLRTWPPSVRATPPPKASVYARERSSPMGLLVRCTSLFLLRSKR